MAKNRPTLEIVPRNRLDESKQIKDAITQMIEEKVAEAIGGPTAAFQPFFQTKQMLTAIRRAQSVPEQQKFVYYFERWGCMVCGTREGGHHAVGMCGACHNRIGYRLKAGVLEHTNEEDTYHDAADLAVAALDPSINAINVTPNHRERERYFTQVEAAKAAGIAPKTLYVWLRNGDIQPSVQVTPKKWLYTEADVEELKLLKRKNASLHNSEAARARWNKQKALPGEVSE